MLMYVQNSYANVHISKIVDVVVVVGGGGGGGSAVFACSFVEISLYVISYLWMTLACAKVMQIISIHTYVYLILINFSRYVFFVIPVTYLLCFWLIMVLKLMNDVNKETCTFECQ